MFHYSSRLLLFAILTLIYSVAFNFIYEGYLLFDNWVRASSISILYLLTIIVTGAVISGRDRTKLLCSGIGFTYHLSAFIIVNVIRILWSISWHHFYTESNVYSIALVVIWGLILGIHFIVAQRNERSDNNEDVFE